jgi:hypothetical protein
MINSIENLSLDQVFIRNGQLLWRSLHGALSNVVSDAVPDSIQTRSTSITTAQWTIKKPSETPRTLPEYLVAVLDALSTLLPHVTWINRQAQPGQDDRFVERHRHGLITGPGGLFECSNLTLGLALMAPDTTYPFHHHPPAEFYLVLSPGQWYREDVGWWSPGAGGAVFNPPSCIHAMKSTDAPLFALWGLMH